MKLSLLKLPHMWLRDIAQYNRSHRVLVLFEIQKLGVSKVTLGNFWRKNGNSSYIWIHDLWRQVKEYWFPFAFIGTLLKISMTFTSYLPAHT